MGDDLRRRVVATIEARMTSSRLPGKVLMAAGGKPLLQVLIERLSHARSVDGIVVATTVNSTDDPIASLAEAMGVGVFRGSEEDVLGRVRGALRAAAADVCVEITGDCPLLDPAIVDEVVAEYLANQDLHPYVSNSDPHRSVPAGLDVQVFAAQALHALEAETNDPLDREHVSYGFYRPEAGDRWHPRYVTHATTRGAEEILVTLDYREDYELIRQAHEGLSATHPRYGAAELIGWVRAHPELHEACRAVRNLPRV
ncbi:MAG: cytidylyltransferase domain-containing protein [Chloroflexota bacterium]